MEFTTKKRRHQKERNIADEECDSVAAVLMGVETVQNFLKNEKIGLMVPGMIDFI